MEGGDPGAGKRLPPKRCRRRDQRGPAASRRAAPHHTAPRRTAPPARLTVPDGQRAAGTVWRPVGSRGRGGHDFSFSMKKTTTKKPPVAVSHLATRPGPSEHVPAA